MGYWGEFLRSYGSELPMRGIRSAIEEIVDELWSFSESECDDILRTNVTGNYLTALAFLPCSKKPQAQSTTRRRF